MSTEHTLNAAVSLWFKWQRTFCHTIQFCALLMRFISRLRPCNRNNNHSYDNETEMNNGTQNVAVCTHTRQCHFIMSLVERQPTETWLLSLNHLLATMAWMNYVLLRFNSTGPDDEMPSFLINWLFISKETIDHASVSMREINDSMSTFEGSNYWIGRIPSVPWYEKAKEAAIVFETIKQNAIFEYDFRIETTMNVVIV